MGATAVAQRYQGVEKHSSGFRLLSAMGWKEGEGLGAKKQGIREHVKVRKKHDSAGVGAVEAVKQARDWTLGMAAFDRVLAALNQAPAAPAGAGPVAGPDALGAQPQVAAADDCAGGPAAEPPRKRRKAAPAGGAAEGKRRRAGTAADACASGAPAEPEPRGKRRKCAGAQGDGAQAAPNGAVAAAGGAAESAAAPAGGEAGGEGAAAAGEGRAGGSHLARFTRRRRCKDARSYSGADLAAILGAAPEPGEPADNVGLLPDGPRAACASARLCNMSGGRAGAGGAPAEDAEASATARAPDPEDAWWRRCFVRAGRLGSQAQAVADAAAGLQPARPKIKVAGFSEDDQANLYMAAHDASGKGRQGLGIASRPKKVAGARWQGTKTQLDSGDEAPAAAPAAAAAEDAPAAEASAEARPALQQAAAPEPGLSAARVRKLARRALRAAPGGALKPRRLLRRVAAAGAGGLSLDALLAAVAGGGRLAMVGGRVVLGGAPAPA